MTDLHIIADEPEIVGGQASDTAELDRWQKYGHDRLYLNAADKGTGPIPGASGAQYLDLQTGEAVLEISNTYGHKPAHDLIAERVSETVVRIENGHGTHVVSVDLAPAVGRDDPPADDESEGEIRCDGGEEEESAVDELFDDVLNEGESDLGDSEPNLEECATTLRQTPAVESVEENLTPAIDNAHLVVRVDPDGRTDLPSSDDPLSEVWDRIEKYHHLSAGAPKWKGGVVEIRVSHALLRGTDGYAAATLELAELAGKTSPAAALDWWMTKRAPGLGFNDSQSDWADHRGISHQAVSGNLNEVDRGVDLRSLAAVGPGGAMLEEALSEHVRTLADDA